MKTKCAALVVAGLGAFLPSPSVAEPSLADQKTAADIQSSIVATEAARQKLYLDAIGSVKPGAEGKTTITDPANLAESLRVSDYALRDAAAKLATSIRTVLGGKKVLIIVGTDRPSVAQWLAFDEIARRMTLNVCRTHNAWEAANSSKTGDCGHSVYPELVSNPAGGGLPSVSPVALGIDAITGLIGLFKVDTSLQGAAVSPDAALIKAVIGEALGDEAVDLTALQIPGAPSVVRTRLQELDQAIAVLSSDYQTYLGLLAAKGGKADALPAPVSGAGKLLETVLGQYDTFVSKLFDPSAGVLLSTQIEEQERLFRERESSPLLYVRSEKAAITATTKKSFFSGFGPRPAYLTATVTIDYALTIGSQTWERSLRTVGGPFAVPQIKRATASLPASLEPSLITSTSQSETQPIQPPPQGAGSTKPDQIHSPILPAQQHTPVLPQVDTTPN